MSMSSDFFQLIQFCCCAQPSGQTNSLETVTASVVTRPALSLDEHEQKFGLERVGGELPDRQLRGEMHLDTVQSYQFPPHTGPPELVHIPERGKDPEIYEIEFFKHSTLGISLDTLDQECLVVSSIKEGLVKQRNESCEDSCEVRQHDRIRLVNGVPGSAEELVRMIGESAGKITLTLERPWTVDVCVERSDLQNLLLGKSLESSRDSTNLRISHLNDALTAKLSETSQMGNRIKVGDRVAAVNRQSGYANDLFAVLERCLGKNAAAMTVLTLKQYS
eukprot:TRINITY_DN9756_c1_g1_i1.p1 TRINITY_DN9756_c1_g1~~TRINITY_DN9756_c1_g1_i1.p1  ORF type:complete len:300 (+),score=19.45 TRINITY_DN9756_c1_g1_i1:71-901(+)